MGLVAQIPPRAKIAIATRAYTAAFNPGRVSSVPV